MSASLPRQHGRDNPPVEPAVEVWLDDGTVVIFTPDGRAGVDLAAMRVSRHDLEGHVQFDRGGIVVSSKIEDAYDSIPLGPHVVRATVNAAWRQVKKARRVARQILSSG